MAELFLNPDEFQDQVDALVGTHEAAVAIAYPSDAGSLALQCVERYVECLQGFNDAIVLYGKLVENDIEALKQLKADWMAADNDYSTMTAGEAAINIIMGTGSGTGKSGGSGGK